MRRAIWMCFAWIIIGLLAGPLAAEESLRGHGGPVRALAVQADGRVAISGSFDSSGMFVFGMGSAHSTCGGR